MDIVQYNEDNRAFSGSKTANITIKTLCDIMVLNDSSETTAFQRYGKVNDLMLAATERNCTDFKYLKSVKDMQQTTWDSSAADGERQCKTSILFHNDNACLGFRNNFSS